MRCVNRLPQAMKAALKSAKECNGGCEGREVTLAQSACKQLHSTEILLLELLRKQRGVE